MGYHRDPVSCEHNFFKYPGHCLQLVVGGHFITKHNLMPRHRLPGRDAFTRILVLHNCTCPAHTISMQYIYSPSEVDYDHLSEDLCKMSNALQCQSFSMPAYLNLQPSTVVPHFTSYDVLPITHESPHRRRRACGHGMRPLPLVFRRQRCNYRRSRRAR